MSSSSESTADNNNPPRAKRPSDSSSSAEPSKRAATTDLVLCSSGIYGDEYTALEKSCEKLNAKLVSEWSDSVTHLVMTKLSWSPKLLNALAGLVAVVNPTWVERAAEQPEPLPDASDPQYWPKASGSSTVGVAAVQPARACLFKGRKFITLPGAPADTRELLSKMGATVDVWPDGETGSEAYFAARSEEGFAFVLPGDEKWPTSPEAKAAVAAGSEVITPLLVRTSLIMAKVSSARHLQSSSLVRSDEDLYKSGAGRKIG